MKKLFLCLIVTLALPIAVFADWGFGLSTFLKSPVLAGQEVDTSNLNVDQFSFGGDLRYTLGWFQAEGLMLYSAGDINSINIYLDAGVALDVSIVRLSVGAGPNFANNFGESRPVQAGLNARIGADVMLGNVSCGLSYIMALNLKHGVVLNTRSGLLGLSVLYWM